MLASSERTCQRALADSARHDALILGDSEQDIDNPAKFGEMIVEWEAARDGDKSLIPSRFPLPLLRSTLIDLLVRGTNPRGSPRWLPGDRVCTQVDPELNLMPYSIWRACPAWPDRRPPFLPDQRDLPCRGH